MDEKFSIYSPYFYEYAKTGVTVEDVDLKALDWFQLTMANEICSIVESLGCKCKVSDKELENIHQLWMRDVSALLINGGGTPDHFKQAGILAYWIRRRAPIREFQCLTSYDTEEGRYRQNTLNQMSSELVAFIIGYDLCRYAEARIYTDKSDNVFDFINSKRPNFKYAHDVCVVMKNKHMSPHALMMIYRALFL